jgi:hypothetical protein
MPKPIIPIESQTSQISHSSTLLFHSSEARYHGLSGTNIQRCSSPKYHKNLQISYPKHMGFLNKEVCHHIYIRSKNHLGTSHSSNGHQKDSWTKELLSLYLALDFWWIQFHNCIFRQDFQLLQLLETIPLLVSDKETHLILFSNVFP